MDSLYSENHIWGRLFRKFMDLFPQATKPTKKLLALFLIGQLCTEHFTSVRNLHKTFLSSVCDKKLNSYYHALSNDKIANTQIRQILAKISLSIIPKSLAKKPVVIAIDDTTIAKFGKKFADVQYLYDHSIHDSKNRMVNGHCFVSLTMSVPVMETRIGKYKVTHRIVKTNLFGNRSVHAYVTSSSKGARRLVFSTASVPELHMSCAWLENSELKNCPVEEAFFYPLKLYKLRWYIETNYYEHKTFWSIDKYMVRKHIGIERLLNMINIAHSMTKILPYIDNMFYEYRNMSAQEFRHKLNELINKEIFFWQFG